jgi:hypothetical protein
VDIDTAKIDENSIYVITRFCEKPEETPASKFVGWGKLLHTTKRSIVLSGDRLYEKDGGKYKYIVIENVERFGLGTNEAIVPIAFFEFDELTNEYKEVYSWPKALSNITQFIGY